jgi:hypothetical protein
MGLWKGDEAVEGLVVDVSVDHDLRAKVEKMKRRQGKDRKEKDG